ncbi:hypothetical protein DRJ04_01130 [Candidatus Aerophobetes bacterium]|uniref:Uncharacterized protein n=1 Tax=Aerophobetes bacterium TaxID=2030807 RepID=A0A662DJN5_UNCAE|nr:MAG: hypothetical protein DRJ04_01130 [Candidatus Aerophobetes bacterium]
MKTYLKAVMTEQIQRGLSLKKLIPHPLKYAELGSLADRCSRIIDKNIEFLHYLLRELDTRDERDLRDIFRGFRSCAREMELIEYFGVSALYHQTPEIGYLNKLVHKIHREINFPLTPPGVACISTNYYYFHPLTNVIFVPIGESDFLLHLPDLFHEMGHEILRHRENDLKLKTINENYSVAIKKINECYSQLLTKKRRETGPKEILRLIKYIHDQWKDYWLEEFFSDLFALYTLGPAYAWSHLHVTIKKSENVYNFSIILPQTHPSDDARMRMLIMGLKILGFTEAAKTILSKWKTIPLTKDGQPVVEYQYAYVDDLMEEIASIFLEGIKGSEFSIVTPKRLENLGEDSIVKLLNKAWEVFWQNPSTFREWEEKEVQRLKSNILQ